MGRVTPTTSTQSSTETSDRAGAVLSSLQDLVLVRDVTGVVTYCNESISGALGYQPADVVGTKERDMVHPADVAALDAVAANSRSGGPPLPPIDVRYHDSGGRWHWFEIIETNRLDDPDIRGIVTNARDVSARRAERAELIERSRRDVLTGIPNRLALTERLDVALARSERARNVVAVMFCDLDDFKRVNDTYGHDFADAVLVEVARRLERLQRKTDTVARIGGDEFVVVCDGLHDVAETATIASRIRAAIEQPIVVQGAQCVVSASIGIATVDGNSSGHADSSALLRSADAAMYRAKRRGSCEPSGWHRFDADLAADAARRLELEVELVTALEHGEFVMHYEPIHELADRTVVGGEAFLRWEHPTRGYLQPAQFIDIAEQTGMIVPIGAWALRAACLEARGWHDAGWPGWMSVNLTSRELAEPGLAARVAATLEETGMAPDRLCLELAEHVLMHAGSSTLDELRAVQQLGVHIGVDEFGTGHAPLPRLRQLPTDYLKIDGAIVGSLTNDGNVDPPYCDVVAALVQIGSTLGLSVIADGIHTDVESEILVECGCKYGQGEWLAVPGPAL